MDRHGLSWVEARGCRKFKHCNDIAESMDDLAGTIQFDLLGSSRQANCAELFGQQSHSVLHSFRRPMGVRAQKLRPPG